MNQLISESAYFGACISLIAYAAATWLKKKWNFALLNPLLISIALVIAALKLLHIDYANYFSSAKYLSYLLTPATVSLAIPLYQQLHLLRKNLKAILLGILSGVLASLSVVFLLSLLFRLDHRIYITLLPKSVTTAIGLPLAEQLGGDASIASGVIIVTGVLGNLFAEGFLRLLGVSESVARGIAIGTSSHAIGTARAVEMGETEGAMSSLSIVVAGLMTVIGASIFAQFL